MPRLGLARDAYPVVGQSERLVLVGYLESGGSAVPVEAPTSGIATTVTGHVFDSLSGRGLSGVVVRLAGADESTITDSVGTFVLKAGVVGPRILTFDHELFSLAPTRREAVVQLTAGVITHVTTSIPGIKTVAGEWCAGQLGGSGVLGLVRGQEAFETDAIMVVAVWFARAGTTAIRRIAERTSPDPRGVWAFCDLPGGQDISLLTLVRGSPVRTQSVRVVAGEFTWHVLAPAADRTTVMLSGTVVDEDRAAPLEGVDIVVLELDRQATTGPEGAFQLPSVPPGSYRVLARRLGYQPLDTALVVSEGRDLRVVVGLRRLPTVLPELSVEAPATALSPNMTSFEERRRTTFGRHFTRDDLDRTNFSTLADLLRRIPRVTVIQVGSEAAAASSTRTSIEGPRYQRPWPSACYMQVVFDGAIVWAPGRTGRTYNINQHSIHWLQAVEVYTGADTPSVFGGTGSTCGTIVLWTVDTL
ncbi:MAG: carboxypeptidase regulatory-like domain-containing protein, partial [Gemmatimonadota bacterium]